MPYPVLTNTFAAITADGQSAAVTPDVAGEFEATVYLGTATFGSGTLVLQTSFDNGTTWHAISGASWTSGTANAQLAKFTAVGTRFRFSVSGSTNPNLVLTLKLERVRTVDIKSFSFTADGSSSSFMLPMDLTLLAWVGQGTFSSGTARIQGSPDGGTTWFQLDSMTSASVKSITTITDHLLRVNVSGSSTPTITVLVAA